MEFTGDDNCEVLENCPLPNNEIIIKEFDSKGGDLKIEQHSVLIHVPEGAVAKNNLVKMKACGNLVGPFILPEDYERVSAFVWVSAAYKFQKQVKMSLEHYYATGSEDDIKDLCVLTANESDKIMENDNLVYKMHEDDTEYHFKADSNKCCILANSWCTKCVAKKRSISSSGYYCLSYGYLTRMIRNSGQTSLYFEICFCYALSDCIQVSDNM